MPTLAQSEARAPIDESVIVPEAVRRAAEKANSHYGPAPAAGDPPADPPAQPDPPAADPPAQPDPVQDPPAGDPPVDPPAAPVQDPPAQDLHPDGSINWEHRYRSMKGRWDQSQTTIGQMQEQMSQLGDELMRTQALVQGASPAEPKPAKNKKLITDADKEAYGDELIDVVKRAAQEALSPELERLQAENNTLKQKVGRVDQLTVGQALDQHVPDWRTVNADPRWKSWLRLPDIYSGRVRQQLLNEASKAADAPRVVSFFKGFLAEEEATGHVDPASRTEPPAPAPAPRAAAKPLESLAAPGRARPASGAATVPADKPIFTRTQIAAFYDDVRRGVYEGRQADKDQTEKAIFSAQNDGRVR